jgi:hypothetical protein
LLANDKFANLDFGPPSDVDIAAWNEAVFGESPSQGSTTPSSSTSSLWEFLAKEESVMTGIAADMGTGVQFQFPNVNANMVGNGIDVPAGDEFMEAMMKAVQSTPERVSRVPWTYLPSNHFLIRRSYRGAIPLFCCGSQGPAQDGYELCLDEGDFYV